MSRHRNRQYDLDDYDDYYDDDYDDYDGYSKPVAVAQKPKPKKKNKKATAPAAGAGAVPAAPAATTAGATPPPPPGLACGGSTSTQSSQPPAASAGASAPGMLHEVHSTHLFSGLSDDEGESKKKHASVAEKGEAELPCLTVIIAGHVDAGTAFHRYTNTPSNRIDTREKHAGWELVVPDGPRVQPRHRVAPEGSGAQREILFSFCVGHR